jgi:hydrogenase nickel incorporation protein HypB
MEIKVVQKVLGANDAIAAQNRAWFREKRVFVINVMSSPGSGKTTLLERTLAALSGQVRTGVIVGDIATTYDSERLARSGAPVVQINTEPFGGDCHLAAHVIREAASGLNLDDLDLLIVENVGNLVCPAEFDIGEDKKVVVLSVAEGEDKPLKYPLMFRVCDAAVLNKVDLLPHLDYNKPLALENIRRIHPEIPVFELSAKTGQGLDQWLNWLTGQVKTKK